MSASRQPSTGDTAHVDKLRHWWADLLTWQHMRWLARRERSPWPYVAPLAAIVALIGPH